MLWHDWKLEPNLRHLHYGTCQAEIRHFRFMTIAALPQ